MSDAPPLDPAVEPLSFLLGTWRGTGRGDYPTIDPFPYVEEIMFGHVGKAFLAYAQKTRHGETDLPLHTETGYWRLAGADAVELILAHPTGILECLTGALSIGEDGRRVMDLGCTPTLSPTAKPVTETRRVFTVDGDELRYDMSMAAVGQPMTHHLSATLHRV